MNRPSGFVPIPFHLVGKVLLVVGATALLISGLALAFRWFSIPPILPLSGLAGVIIGLYLIFVVPREDGGKT